MARSAINQGSEIRDQGSAESWFLISDSRRLMARSAINQGSEIRDQGSAESWFLISDS
jgi:hypothetical protein